MALVVAGLLARVGVALADGAAAPTARLDPSVPARDPAQPVDEEYTKKIREYTTAPYFLSPLVDYLPASKTVPTPAKVLGDIAGAPGRLPYSTEVYRYMRDLAAASPRVKVFSIGRTEEGREMIAVAVTSEANMAKLEENRARLARLGDPRTINLDDAEAAKLIDASVPVYYITGTIHSPETGAPTALMELAYRLAVDESPYIASIRDRVITLITPIVEVDGRDRMVDLYKWHLAHPGQAVPPLIYWGHYVAHDNNRDSMGLTLALSRNILTNAVIGWHVQVLHDLHESVPYLYDNTEGDAPYNAWLDPILTDEWHLIAWNNVAEMTKFGMPGVFTHGDFDTWSPGYLMFQAATHNSISRLYETFGNGGADTVERTLSPGDTSRTWYRQNPPLPKANWSQRNNNNYEQTGLLTSLHYFADNGRLFLQNYYRKSKNSILKPTTSGPAAYVLPGDDARPAIAAELVRLMQLQGAEVHRATATFSVSVEAPKRPAERGSRDEGEEDSREARAEPPPPPTKTVEFPAGSFIVRMDQPYSRIADMLLDLQYWSPTDPQEHPYDDTGWTFGELFNAKVVRVTDLSILKAPMTLVAAPFRMEGGVSGETAPAAYAINHSADNTLISLRYELKDVPMLAAEAEFEAGGQRFGAGSFIIKNAGAPPALRARLEKAAAAIGVHVVALSSIPAVATHPVGTPRVAIVHSWLFTQGDGWYRQAFDKYGVPYTYISVQTVARTPNLREKFDAIVFPPVSRFSAQLLVSGLPMWGNPLPWKTTPETPNLGGRIDETDDMRPGLGLDGVARLQGFARQGGLLILVGDTADLGITYGFTPGVSTAHPPKLKIIGDVLKARFVDRSSPIAYGYGDTLSVYCDDAAVYAISNLAGGRGGRRRDSDDRERATGRGSVDSPDVPQLRGYVAPPPEPKAEKWEALPVTDEQRRTSQAYIIPPQYRPRVILRYADTKELLVSGLIDGATELAQHPAVVDVPTEQGHVVLFSNNPVWRGETLGSYSLVFNAILNFDHLNAGRKNEAEKKSQ